MRLTGLCALILQHVHSLPLCNTTVWSGPCTWPSTPPPDNPFPLSTDLTGVSFSGRFGHYPTTAADTWYPSWDARTGALFSSFADGKVCTSPPGPPPPVPPAFAPLLWWWSEAQQDNVLSTTAFPPANGTAGLYKYVGVAGYALTDAPGGCELYLYRAPGGTREYWTACGAAEAGEAAAAGYALVAALGAFLPAAAGDNATALPPSSPTDLPPAWAAQGAPQWVGAQQYFSAARGDHFLTPMPSAPPGYVRAAPPSGPAPPARLLRLQLSGGGAPQCVDVYGENSAQGAAVIAGEDPFNLTVAAVYSVHHPSLAPLNASFPGAKGIYPSTSFVFNGSWVIGYYLLADPSGAGCGNWCHLGPLLAFAVGASSPSPAGQNWSYFGAPFWGGGGRPEGVFEPIDVTVPIRMGVPRFVDLGRDLEHSPDGRAYLLGKGCAANDGVHCSFMTGDSLYLARTREPLASLGGNMSALNAAQTWEFFAGRRGGGDSWAPTLAGSAPLLVWPGGMGGATMTYNAALGKFLIVVNVPGDRVRSTDCKFNTFVLEGSSVTGPFALVSYMEALGPQMYFQQLSSKFWSADGRTGILFSSGNWDGKCITQGSNPPGERYGMVTTELTFETGARL